MKKIIVSLFSLCLFAAPGMAYDFEADGIYYSITSDNEVSVVWGGSGYWSGTDSYTGDITIPESVSNTVGGVTTTYAVTGVGDDAFDYCTSLTSITIPNSVTKIGGWAFAYCYKLATATIGNGVAEIGEGAFCYCYDLDTITIVGDNPYYCTVDNVIYTHDMTDLVVFPGGFQGVFDVPEGVTTIKSGAFAGCSVNSVNISDSVTKIETGAFEECNMASITFGNGLKEIGSYAFNFCMSLESVDIPESVTTLGEWAFSYCYALETATIGCGTIGDFAFYECMSLASVTLYPNVTTIGESAFQDCLSLRTVEISSGVKTIGSSAFYYSGLRSIDIPDNVTSVGRWSFGECYYMKSATIGSGVASIGDYAFCYCTDLASITVSEDNPYYCTVDNAIYTKDMTVLVAFPGGYEGAFDVPDGVTEIATGAFADCEYLTAVSIPNSVTSIGINAFWYCMGMSSITIGSGVTSIGNYAFEYCWSLGTVTMLNPEPPTCGSIIFLGDSNVKVSVPAGTIDVYMNDWADVTNMILEESGYAVFKITEEEDGVGYDTYYNKDYAVTLPEGVTAYTVSGISEDDGVASVTLASVGDVIPASTAVVLKGTCTTYTDVEAEFVEDAKPGMNMLHGNCLATTTTGPDDEECVFFKFTYMDGGGMGFYYGADNGGTFDMPANKAWLAVPKDAISNGDYGLSLDFDDETTGIRSVEGDTSSGAIYTIQGIRVSSMGEKGIYIIDGKKVLVK